MSDKEIVIPDPNALGGAAIEQKAEAVALGKAKTSPFAVFMLAILAGMFIACGAILMTLVKAGDLDFVTASILGGACFSLGLIAVVIAGAELFTGNNLMVCAAMSKTISWGDLAKNWAIVYVGNLVGSLIMVALITGCKTGALNGGAVYTTMMNVAIGKISLDWGTIICRGIMCNFLVCLAVWMGFAGKSVIDKIFTCMIPVMAFVALGFEHCVANMFFLPMGLAAKATSGADLSAIANIDLLTVGGAVYNIFFASIGNIIGGAIFFGLIYWLAYKK